MARKTTREEARLEQLADRLHSTAIHLLRLVRRQDSATGIGPAQLSALSVLVFGGPLSLNQLAEAEQVRAPTMSRIVDALQEAGLARRLQDQQDRRAVLIHATVRGSKLLHQGRRRRVKFLAGRLHMLKDRGRKRIEIAVGEIEKALRPSAEILKPERKRRR
ncbi:MAG TPA: MarR family transcriptional regulator [Terriglobales bacterium]|nr:MarR family transcriptional regulator [Terriglobales bacterium]